MIFLSPKFEPHAISWCALWFHHYNNFRWHNPHKLLSSSLCSILNCILISYLLRINTFLSTFFLISCNLHPFLTVRSYFSHLYQTNDKM
jgi:hypothetical protein